MPQPSVDVESLPFVDERRVRIQAPTDVVWRRVARTTQRQRGRLATGYARLVGADPVRATGTPPAVGTTLPGFAVVESEPPSRLLLAGRHRFSEYALVITLTEDAGGRTLLAARTFARFPGALGRVYRAAVISSGAHRILVQRLLRRIAHAAEAEAQRPTAAR